jgi:hypothetical protein
MRFHFRPATAALFLLVCACPRPSPGPGTQEPQTFLLVKLVDGKPMVVQQAAPTPGVLYVGIPFARSLPRTVLREEYTETDAGDGALRLRVPLIVCDPADCNPPNKVDERIRPPDEIVTVTSGPLGLTTSVTSR